MSAKAFFVGLRWTGAATVINFGAQFVVMGVLARLLDPTAFGLMAMVSIVLRFATYFAQMGAGPALIQKQELAPRDMGAALFMALGVSTFLYGLLWLFAPLAGVYFRSDALIPMVRVAGLNLVISALAGLALAYLRREGRFATLSVVEVTSYVFGYGAVGTVCAYLGLGVWSLIIASISQAALCCLLGFTLAQPKVEWKGARGAIRHFWGYGSKHSLTGFLEFIGANIETLYMGRFMGQHTLGLYNRGQVITNLPVEQSVNAFGKVMFPMLARLQHDRAKLGEVFLGLLLGIGLLATPLSFGISAVAEDIVAILLGPKWSQSADIVRLLALCVPAMFMYFACGIMLDSIASLSLKLRIQSIAILFKLGLVLGLAAQGLHGVLVAVVTAEYLRLLLGLYACRRELSLRAARMAGSMAFTLLTGILVYTAVHFSHAGLLAIDASLWTRLAIEVSAGLFAMAAVIFLALHLLPQNSPWRTSAVFSRPLAYMSRLACVRATGVRVRHS